MNKKAQEYKVFQRSMKMLVIEDLTLKAFKMHKHQLLSKASMRKMKDRAQKLKSGMQITLKW